MNDDWLYDCIAVLLEQKRIKIVTNYRGEKFYKLITEEAVAIPKEKARDGRKPYSEVLGVWWQDLRPNLRGSNGYGYLRPLPQ